VKLDFSATNFKSKVTGWRISIENKFDTLFPAVCDTARGFAGIAAAVDSTQLEHHDPQILARANLASDDEEDEKDNIQAIDEDHGDKFDEHHDNGGDNDHRDNNLNGVDDGNNSGVDGDHNDGGDDLDGHDHVGAHDNEVDDSNDNDNEGGKGIGSEEDEDNSKASLSYRGINGNDGDNDNDETEEEIYANDKGDDNDETEEKNYTEGAEVSDLTEIGSSSDVSIVEVAPASGSCRKGIQRGRH